MIETPEKDEGDIAPWCNYLHWIAARTLPDIRSESSCADSSRLKHSRGI